MRGFQNFPRPCASWQLPVSNRGIPCNSHIETSRSGPLLPCTFCEHTCHWVSRSKPQKLQLRHCPEGVNANWHPRKFVADFVLNLGKGCKQFKFAGGRPIKHKTAIPLQNIPAATPPPSLNCVAPYKTELHVPICTTNDATMHRFAICRGSLHFDDLDGLGKGSFGSSFLGHPWPERWGLGRSSFLENGCSEHHADPKL